MANKGYTRQQHASGSWKPKTTKSSKQEVAEDGLPILQINLQGDQSMLLHQWKEAMESACGVRYKQLAEIFITEEYRAVEYPADPLIELQEKEDALYEEKVTKAREAAKAKYRQDHAERHKMQLKDAQTEEEAQFLRTKWLKETRVAAEEAEARVQEPLKLEEKHIAKNDKMRYEHKYKQALDKEAELAEYRTPMFHFMWAHLSKESRETVKRAEGWTRELEVAKDDPRALWTLIKEAHSYHSTGDHWQDVAEVRSRYRSIQMNRGESLQDFKTRFDLALAAFREVGLDTPTNLDQATDFMESLDDQVFDELRTSIHQHSRLTKVSVHPTDLGEAMRMAGDFARNHDKAKIRTPTQVVFKVEAKKSSGTPFSQPTQQQQGNVKKHHQEKPGQHEPRDEKNKNKTKIKCMFCGKPGHYATECWNNRDNPKHKMDEVHWTAERGRAVKDEEEDGEDEEDLCNLTRFSSYPPFSSPHPPSTALDQVALTSESGNGEGYCHLDNQASVSIFGNPNLLTNIRLARRPRIIRGIAGGATIKINLVGTFETWGTVYFSPEASANILSWTHMRRRGHHPRWDQQRNEFVLQHSDRQTSLTFQEEHGVYVCHGGPLQKVGETPTAGVLVSYDAPATVKAREDLYTKSEVKRARQAVEVMKRLGWTTPESLIKIINSGGIANMPVTAADVHRSLKILGRPSAVSAGRTTTTQATAVTRLEDELRLDFREVEQRLNVDLLFVEDTSTLICVSSPLGLVHTVDLAKRKDTATLWTALQVVVRAYAARGFKISTILSDGEQAISNLRSEINGLGIVFNPAGPNQHVPVVEATIRRLKEHMRSIVDELPYFMPPRWLPMLIAFATSRYNLHVPSNRGSPISPREAFTGIKTEWGRDCRFAFGNIVQYRVPYQDNSLAPRVEKGIALYPKDNAQGSAVILSLDSGELVTRDHFKVVPIEPSDVIALNAMFHAMVPATAKRKPAWAGKANQPELWKFLRNVSTNSNPLGRTDQEVVPRSTQQRFDQDEREHATARSHTADQPQQAARGVDCPPALSTVGPPPGLPPPGPQSPAPKRASEPLTRAAAEEQDEMFSPLSIINLDFSLEAGAAQEQPFSLEESSGTFAHVGMEDAPNAGPDGRGDDTGASQHLTNEEPQPETPGRVLQLSVKAAIAKFGEPAREALKAEIQQILRMGTFVPVHVGQLSSEERRAIIRSSAFLTEKLTPQGEVERLKGRFTAGGDTQDKALYERADTTAPTIATSTVFMVAAIAASEGRSVVTADIGSAYLNAEIGKATVHMTINPSIAELVCELDTTYKPYLRQNGTLVVRLVKALYGCVQSAAQWYKHLRAVLEKLGFVPNPCDLCCFNRGEPVDQVTVGVHVDDLLVTAHDPAKIEQLLADLRTEFTEVKVKTGDEHSYLGMNLRWDRDDGAVEISMPGFVTECIESNFQLGLDAKTPATNELFDRGSGELLDEKERALFQSTVAKLLYLAKRTRPDLLTLVAYLTTVSGAPTERDQTKLVRGLRYLRGSREMGVRLKASSDMKVIAFVDASFAVHPGCKSHTGMIVSLGEGPIFTKSGKQKLVTRSSTEAELVALSDACAQVVWTREFLLAQGYHCPAAILYEDNKSTIELANPKKFSNPNAQSRHINIKNYFVRDRQGQGEVEVLYKPTDEMVADLLTKPLQGQRFRDLRARLLNWPEPLLQP